jgi:hypothetical protein
MTTQARPTTPIVLNVKQATANLLRLRGRFALGIEHADDCASTYGQPCSCEPQIVLLPRRGGAA